MRGSWSMGHQLYCGDGAGSQRELQHHGAARNNTEHRVPRPSRGLALGCPDSSRREFLRTCRRVCCHGSWKSSGRADARAAPARRPRRCSRRPESQATMAYSDSITRSVDRALGRFPACPCLGEIRGQADEMGRQPLRCESAGELYADNFDRRCASVAGTQNKTQALPQGFARWQRAGMTPLARCSPG